MKDTQHSAAALYDGGWRSKDRDELMKEYGLTQDEADDLVKELKGMEHPAYMVDVDKAAYEQGAWVGSGDPHGTEYANLSDAEAEYDRLVDYWQAQPDKPVIISLSEYEPEYDAWSGVKHEVVK